ncbi:hypothetical protein [Lactococcus ileimucosae]
MKMAKGKYIAFMDNDDQLGGEGSLYEMFVYAEKWESDLLMGKNVAVSNSGSASPHIYNHGNIGRVNILDVHFPAVVFVWSALHRKDFLVENNIVFREDNTSYEDYYFMAQVYAKTDRISILANQTYYYWQRKFSEHNLSSDFSMSQLEKMIDQLIQCMNLFEGSEFQFSHGAGFFEKVMLSPAFHRIFIETDERHAFLFNQRMHQILREAFKNSIYKPYMTKHTKTIYDILQVEDFSLSRNLQNAYKRVNKATPEQFIKLSPQYLEQDEKLNILRKNALLDFNLRDLGNLKKSFITLHLQGDVLFVKPSPEIVGKDFKLFISNRELTSYISYPFEEEITINIQSIKEFLVRNKTIDFYVGRETEAGIAATKIAGKYSEKIYPYLSKNKRPVLYTWEDEKSIELYVNWKGGLGLLVE